MRNVLSVAQVLATTLRTEEQEKEKTLLSGEQQLVLLRHTDMFQTGDRPTIKKKKKKKKRTSNQPKNRTQQYTRMREKERADIFPGI